jgi:putative membrane protein
MAGGGVPVGETVLYTQVIVPVVRAGEVVLLRYDQLVHFYGFGITAWLLWHLLRRHFPDMDGSVSIYAFAALGSMELGAVNEIIEFAAVVMFPQTNVGG